MVTQVWYTDDASALGSIVGIRKWWDNLVNIGPSFGYFANPTKTWLITKDSCLSNATAAFADTKVNITSSGRPYLGTPLGSPEYTNQFIRDKVEHWSNELKTLSEIATTQPQAAYAAFTHGFFSKWSHGFPSIRHNEIRDITANLLTEVCHDVSVEPGLQPLTVKHRPSKPQTHLKAPDLMSQ